MINKILDRLEVVAGVKPEIEESRGISDGTWNGMNSSERRKYVKEHPHSRFAKDLGGKSNKPVKKVKNTPTNNKFRPLTRDEIEKTVDFKRCGFDFDDKTWSKAFDIIKDIENKDLDDKSVGEIKAYFKKFDSSNKNLNDALLLGLLSKGMSNVAYGTEDLEGSAKLNKVYKKLFGFGSRAAKYPKDDESLYDKHPEMNNKSTHSRGASAKNGSHEKLLHYLKRYD